MSIKVIVEGIPYAVALMMFWDLSIHIIDWRDRKYAKAKRDDKTWSFRLLRSKSIFSYYYPHFWGKQPHVRQDVKDRRYDIFWITFWGTGFVLMVVYLLTG